MKKLLGSSLKNRVNNCIAFSKGIPHVLIKIVYFRLPRRSKAVRGKSRVRGDEESGGPRRVEAGNLNFLNCVERQKGQRRFNKNMRKYVLFLEPNNVRWFKKSFKNFQIIFYL